MATGAMRVSIGRRGTAGDSFAPAYAGKVLDGVKQHGRLNDNHLGRLDGDDCRRLMVHVVAPVKV